MKKIAFLISSLNTGGAQRAVSNITMNWPDDFEIDLILNDSRNIKYPYKGRIIDLGLNEPKSRTSIFYQIKVLIKRIRILKKLKKKNNYIACISFLDSANIANILTKVTGCKTIVSVRSELSQDKTAAYRFIVTPLVKLFYNKADRVVALSKGVEMDLLRNYKVKPEKVLTIYNCYDIERLRRLSSEQTINFPEYTFINIGRLTYQKGQWHLIRAFAELIRAGYNCRLVILGDGELKADYTKLIKNLHIESFVELKGFVDNPFSYLKAASCFVFPSMFEGFGNAIIEALTCELPVIATDFRSGAREILAPDTNVDEKCNNIYYAKYGILVPVCESDLNIGVSSLTEHERVLFQAMLQIIKDKKIAAYYQHESLKCIERYKPENIINQWLGLL